MMNTTPDPTLILLILRLAEWAGLQAGISQPDILSKKNMVRVVVKLPNGDIGWDIPRASVEGYWPELSKDVSLPKPKKQLDLIRHLFHSRMVLRRELHLFTEDPNNDKSKSLPPS